MRSCLACRRRDDKSSLIRLAIANGTIVPDPSANIPGRGAYLCHRTSCTDSALARGGLRLTKALRVEPGAAHIDEQAIRTAASSSGVVARTARGVSPIAGVSE